MSNIWTVPQPTTHMRQLCCDLGPEYIIRELDLERVIYRDFGNGYNVEVSAANTSSKRKPVNLYLWRGEDRKIGSRLQVPQDRIHEEVERLRAFTETILPEDFDEHGFFSRERYEQNHPDA